MRCWAKRTVAGTWRPQPCPTNAQVHRGAGTGATHHSTTSCAAHKLTKKNGRTLAEDPTIRQRLAQLTIEIDVARCLSYRVATTQSQDKIPGPESPANKVFTSEMIQRLAQVGMQMLGLYGQLEFHTKWAPLKGKIERLYLTSVAGTIAGGTSEIQRNIIAERGLGLPDKTKEPATWISV